jgi:hypothetical protein
MCGWTMNERRRKLISDDADSSVNVTTTTTTSSTTEPTISSTDLLQQQLDEWAKGVTLLNLAVILYYAFVMEALTTIAHVCALILGATLDMGTWSLVVSEGRADGSRESSSSTPLLEGETNTSAAPPLEQSTM